MKNAIGWTRETMLIVFAVSAIMMGCTSEQRKHFDEKVIAPTTQAVATVNETANVIAATTPAGTGVHEWALFISAISGVILATEKSGRTALKLFPKSAKKTAK